MPSLEWIKLTCDLPDKWQTQAIRRTLKLKTIDEVVGKLFRVWRHFENQSKNGFIPRMAREDLDELVGKKGFAAAMLDVGWLEITPEGMRIPNYSEHMGGASRERDANAERQRRHREQAATLAAQQQDSAVTPTVTPPLQARDGNVTVTPPKKEKEKEKEEEKTTPQPPAGGSGTQTTNPKSPRPKAEPKPQDDPRFQQFWDAYPRKAQEFKAATAFAKLNPSPELLAEILAAIASQKSWPRWVKDDGEYIPYPANWLENRQWRDKPPEVGPGPDDVPAQDGDDLAELRRMAANLGYGVGSAKEVTP